MRKKMRRMLLGCLSVCLFGLAFAVLPAGAQTTAPNEWTWMGGSSTFPPNTAYRLGVYGTLGVPAAANVPSGRIYETTWTDASGNFWLFGGYGYDSAGTLGYLNDLWEFRLSVNEWTWVNGSNTVPIVDGYGTGNPGVYGTLGVAAAANIAGSRQSAAAWTDSKGNVWIFGGFGYDQLGNDGELNDLWEFNPATNLWTWMGGSSVAGNCGQNCEFGLPGVYGTEGVPAASNLPGGRHSTVTWTDQNGNLWLFGGYGAGSTYTKGTLNDLWEFNPSTNEWAWISGSSTFPACASSTSSCGQPGVYGTKGVAAPGNVPGARGQSIGWTDSSGNLWLFGGSGYDSTDTGGLLDDLWEFNPSNAEWTWMGGSQTLAQPGVYGILGIAFAGNIPGSRATSVAWTDVHGNFWLFGGFGITSENTIGDLDDLWEFKPSTDEWTWMGGSSTSNSAAGVYGALGVPALANIPGARDSATGWTDSQGNFWLFGGNAFDANDYSGWLNDLWEYQPYGSTLPVAAAAAFSPGTGIYTSIQAVTISDSTPGAVIYYTINSNASPIQYTGPITVTSSETIQAVASASGYANSTAVAASYTINIPPPSAPTFSPASGTFYNVARVLIADAESGTTIYYTTDGSTPTTSSSIYSNGVNITSTGTLQAIAVAPWGATSPVAGATYTINPPQAATPSFSLPVGTYSFSQTVTLSDATAGTAIYYTTDGSIPTISSPEYTAPIPITATETIQAIAAANGYSTSAMAAATYTITALQPPSTPGASNEWIWMGGGFSGSGSGVYGTLGTPAPGNAPGSRNMSVSWTDSKGNLWLFGGWGYDSAQNIGYLNDLWEYSPSSNEWTWMGGSSTLASGLAAGVYGTLGTSASGNIPSGRAGAVRWTDKDGNLWLFGGTYQDFTGTGEMDSLNDLWKFNPAAYQWTWMSGSNTPNQPSVYGTLGTPAPGNVPGASSNGVSWIDKQGNLWLLEGNVLWEFYPTTNLWAWMGGSENATCNAVYGTLGVPASTNLPGNRSGAVSWTDESGNFWMFGGSGCDSASNGGNLNDLWKYSPSTQEWTWMSGADTTGQPGIYGTLQTPAIENVPGSRTGAVSWTDSKGNFWLFGGVGRDSTSTSESYLNDLWEFNLSTNEWAWMSGSAVADGFCATLANWCGQLGVVGTFQTPALGNTPSGRYDSVGWTDSAGNFWLFSGNGYPELGVAGSLNDLWEYQTNTGARSVTATPIISPGSGTFTSWQSVTITDATPGATISYLVNGLAPALPYTGPITVSSSESVEAIASASGYANSNIATANYVMNLPQAATPTFSLVPGTYSAAQTVTISDTTPGATIYYAIGATSTVPATLYSGPLTVSSSETLQAMAVADNYLNSSVANAAYNIGANPSAEWTWMGGGSTVPACTNQGACGQPGWYGTLQTPAATNIPEGRWGSVTWTDNKGDFWMFGGVGVQGSLNDLWEYNPATAQWAWIAGNSTVAWSPTSGSGQPGVYGTLGTPSASSEPGSRAFAVGWKDKGGNLWLYGGWGIDANDDVGNLNDLWRFDLSTNQWTWMGGSSTMTCSSATAGLCWDQPAEYGTFGTPTAGNNPGGRSESTGWTDGNGNFWLYGGFGRDVRDDEGYLNDLWEFDPSINEWAWRGGYTTLPSPLAGWTGVYSGQGVPAPENNPWSLYYASSWADTSGNLWLFGGMGEDPSAVGYYINDMWEFSPSTGEWAWMNGTSSGLGAYGSMGAWSPTNTPSGRKSSAIWTDKDGNFWLLGGSGLARGSGSTGLLNDLWEFKPAVNQWAWMGGSNTSTCLRTSSGICVSWGYGGVYGTLGSAASGNTPGGRYSGAAWTDSTGNLWLFGGLGDDAQGTVGYLNDMWQYSLKTSPSVQPSSPAAMPSLSLAAGTYASAQTLTISDQTPGAVIYYTTDGTMPNGTSAVYSSPITVSSSKTFAAIAVANSHSVSALAAASYTVNLPAAATPTFSVPAGTYTSAQTVTISDSTSGATIYYTTDGTTPTAKSTVYTGTISVSATETIQAIAVATGYSNSAVASATYTMNQTQPGFTVSGTALTVARGATTGNTSTLTVTPSGGFTGSVALTATVTSSPSGAQYPPTLSFGSTSPVTITGSGNGIATLTISTTAATSAAMTRPRRSGVPWYGPGGAVLACILLFGIPARRRNWQRMLGALALLVALASGVLACGGGGAGGGGGGGTSTSGTTAGSYTVTVTATSGTITETGTVALTVQ
jgi:N-acetylneuraminic acid mutarotase